ncbi:MAG: aldehyde dehydrogenase family protein [Asticcacaulis sp.]|uniref:aldehyde dehydrogenase family protein n=1 Tax=Asticcacaulis sp. TaxID=1872648 RepID=UPI0039E33664
MQMIIGGHFVDARSGQTFEITNPATGDLIAKVPRANTDDVALAIQSAIRGRDVMRDLPAHKRSDILRKVADTLYTRHEELSQLLCRENGKTIRQCRGEMTATARLFMDFSEEAKRLRGQSIPMDAVAGLEHMIAYTIRQPLGIVTGIVPFNYPAELFAHKIPGAIAAGNAVIVKLPEQCPLTVLKIGEIMLQSGLPGDGLQMLTGFPQDLGDQLITHPEVAMISFTGGVVAARIIARQAADLLKRTAFELGGVDAMIVLADADIDAAATAVVQGRLTNGAGQICCAVKQVYVAERILQPFLDKLVEKVKAIKLGSPTGEDTDIGPLISEQAAERVHREVTRSIEMGAKCLIGGQRIGKQFYAPTVLVDVSEDMPCLRDEVFGPVAPIVPFRDVHAAIRTINATPYGLQASVFSESIHNALGVAHRLEVGGVVVNGAGAFRPGNVPFGGVNQSGIGVESITDTVREMSHETAIVLNQKALG